MGKGGIGGVGGLARATHSRHANHSADAAAARYQNSVSPRDEAATALQAVARGRLKRKETDLRRMLLKHNVPRAEVNGCRTRTQLLKCAEKHSLDEEGNYIKPGTGSKMADSAGGAAVVSVKTTSGAVSLCCVVS